jgi:hypothetical protein
MKPENFADFANAVLSAPIMQAAPAPTAAQAIAAKVDELGQLHAAIADMKRKADQIRTELEDAGLDNIEGQLYRVNFAAVAGRTFTNWEAIAKRLKASPQIIRAYTKTGEPSSRMTVKARQTH